MKNNELNNAFYTCPYCNEEYTEPSDLARCILSCEDKKKREDEERKKAQLALEKENRMKEIEEAEKHYRKLVSSFVKDYGSYHSKRTYDSDTMLSLMPWNWVF